MKKYRIALLALLLVVALCTPVLALDANDSEGETLLTYTVGENYILSIPDTITITKPAVSTTGVVSISGALIANGKVLKVAITTSAYFAAVTDPAVAEGFKFTDGHGSYQAYKITKPGDPTPVEITGTTNPGNVVLTVAAGTAEGTETLTFALDTAEESVQATKAGDHTDTLTFTVTVDPVTP